THAARPVAAPRRGGAPAPREGHRAEGARLERHSLDYGSRGLSRPDRALLRSSRRAVMTGSSDELLLAIDCGTQSVRALLVDRGETPTGARKLFVGARRLAGARRRGVLAGGGCCLPGASHRTRRSQTTHER